MSFESEKLRQCGLLMERWRSAPMVALYTPRDLLDEIDEMLSQIWPLLRNKEPPSIPAEYAKPVFVVPDLYVDGMRKEFGDRAEVIAITDTMLPPSAPEQKP